MATSAETRQGPVGFLKDALDRLLTRSIAVPAGLLVLLLTISNIVIVRSIPVAGETPGAVFAVAAFVRVAGLLVLAVAVLRIVTSSPRRPFVPDAGFWLYALSFLLIAGVSAAARFLVPDAGELLSVALANLAGAVITAPLAAWFVALAVERPASLSPRPWLRRLGDWLPAYLLWTVVLVSPLGWLHVLIDLELIGGGADLFWPLALFDGPLSAVIAILGLGLASEAYRRVAQG